MNAKDALTMRAAQLASRAQPEWHEFLAAFAAYSMEKMGECIKAPVTEVQVAQGRAQACSMLDDLLRSAVTSANRIEKRAENSK
jgi:hypothetical protein